MSFDPFTARVSELQGLSDSGNLDIEQSEKITIEQNPFEKRIDQKKNVSNSLWSGFYDLLFSPKETPLEYGISSAARGIAPAIAGFPGDLIQMIKGGADWIEKKAPVPEILKRDKTFAQEYGSKFLEKVPTTSQLTEKFDELTEGKYLPKSEKEKLLQEMGGDIGLLMLPARTIPKALKAVGAGVLANLAAEGMKELDYGEGSQAATKIGTMMAVSMFDPKSAKRFSENLYKQAYSNLPGDAEISASSLEKNLTGLQQRLQKGLVNVESKKPVLSAIKDAKRNIKNGRVNVKALTEAKKNLNEQRTAKIYDPEFKGGKKARGALKDNYAKLAKTLDKAIGEYGEKNKSFYEPYKLANQTWGGIQQSKKASNFLKRVIKDYKLATSLGSLAGLYNIPTLSFGAAGSAFAGLKSYELMHRIMMNPALRKHYIRALVEASRESAPGVVNNLTKMNKELEKEKEKL